MTNELAEGTFQAFMTSQENTDLAVHIMVMYLNVLTVLRNQFKMKACTSRRIARDWLPEDAAMHLTEIVAEQIYAEWRWCR